MSFYSIQLSGPVPFTVSFDFNTSRIPLLDVVGFGDQNTSIHGKLVLGMLAAGFSLPCYCRILGPGPDVFREVFAPGLPLGLLVALMDAARARVLGYSEEPMRHAWGDIVVGDDTSVGITTIPAAGELAVALEIARQHPGAEFLVPSDLCYTSVRGALGAVPKLTVVVIPHMGLDKLNNRAAARRVPQAQKAAEPTPSVELDAPLLVKLAIEVGIAARLPTVLVGSPAVLDGWATYTRACAPQLASETMLDREALLGLWHQRTPNLLGDAPCVLVEHKTSHDDLVGEIDISADPPGAAGLLVQAHHGMVLVEQTKRMPNGSRARVDGSVLRRIAASTLRFAGEERRLRHTVITAMPACACDPPRELPCRCAGVHAYQIIQQRHCALGCGVSVCVWGDGTTVGSQPTLNIDMRSAAVRDRITRAWAAQDAELGVGARWGDDVNAPIEQVTKALLALGTEPQAVSTIAPMLVQRPW